jgi:ATP-dependent exoDNAse (exonuclease V) alpha subunit
MVELMELTDEQKKVAEGIINDLKKGNKSEIRVGGWAGTGKSVIVKYLSDSLKNLSIACFTGKAASNLRSRGVEAGTIHGLIYEVYKERNRPPQFRLKPSLGCDAIAIDEASMVGRELYADLISFGIPIVFVGDDGQLEPIGEGLNLMAELDYRLTTIHRNAGEIAFFADHIRRGGFPLDFKNSEKVEFIEKAPVELMATVDQMICAFNRTRVAKNNDVRNYLGLTGNVTKGDRVICLKNNKKINLFNGLQGRVLSVNHSRSTMTLEMEDSIIRNKIWFNPNQFGKEKNEFEYGDNMPNPFDYAYCITCHRFQGSQADTVLVFEQSCDLWCNIRWNYTAASRAINKLYWLGIPKKNKKIFVPDWLKKDNLQKSKN